MDPRDVGGAYSYLLGLYLGDGMLTAAPRRVWRLRIVLDQRYPLIIERCQWAIGQVAWRAAGTFHKPGCLEVYSNWKHWLCAFPSTEPGRSTGAQSS